MSEYPINGLARERRQLRRPPVGRFTKLAGSVSVLVAIAAVGLPVTRASHSVAAAAAVVQPTGMLTRGVANPIVPMGAPGSLDGLKTGPRAVVQIGPSDYRMWYEAVPDNGSASRTGNVGTTIAYATSTDGVRWTKKGTVVSPLIGGWEGGNARGNTGEVSPETVLVGTVSKLGIKPGVGGQVFRMWYHAFDGLHRRIGYMESPDGVTWIRDAANPILDVGKAGSWDDKNLSGSRAFTMPDGTMRLYYDGASSVSTPDTGYGLGYATSKDGLVFTKVTVARPILGPFSSEFGIVFAHGSWQGWYAPKSQKGLKFMWSSDGLTWNLPWRLVLAPEAAMPRPTSLSVQPDVGLGDAVSVVLMNGVYSIYYTGANMYYNNAQHRSEAICVATIKDPVTS